MPPRLIIRLDADPDAAVSWLRQDAAGQALETGSSEDLPRVASSISNHQIVALAPGSRVLLTHAFVPTQSRQKLLRALPFALEDQLADDIERLHFAIGTREPDGAWPVAVVERDWLDQWLSRLAELDLTPDLMLPEVLCLPLQEGQWTVLAEADMAMVRTGRQSGFAGDRPNLGVLLSVTLDDSGSPDPSDVLILEDDRQPAAELPPELADVTVTRRPLEDSLTVLGGALDAGTAINLLSGDFARTRSRAGMWRPWIAAASLFAIWLVLDTGQALLEQRAIRAELTAVDSRVEELLKQVFPQARDTRQARTRLENRLAQVRGGNAAGGDDLLGTLILVGPVLQKGGDINFTGMSWRGGDLELELNTADLQRLDRLKQDLDSKAGISAEVRSARSDDEGTVQGRLMVRRTGG